PARLLDAERRADAMAVLVEVRLDLVLEHVARVVVGIEPRELQLQDDERALRIASLLEDVRDDRAGFVVVGVREDAREEGHGPKLAGERGTTGGCSISSAPRSKPSASPPASSRSPPRRPPRSHPFVRHIMYRWIFADPALHLAKDRAVPRWKERVGVGIAGD